MNNCIKSINALAIPRAVSSQVRDMTLNHAVAHRLRGHTNKFFWVRYDHNKDILGLPVLTRSQNFGPPSPIASPNEMSTNQGQGTALPRQ